LRRPRTGGEARFGICGAAGANANGGNRAAGTSGYDRSAEYVAERLKEAGYAIRFEEFQFPYFEGCAPLLTRRGVRALFAWAIPVRAM
jgi:hypothetical protein